MAAPMQDDPLLLPVKVYLGIVRDRPAGDRIDIEEPFDRVTVPQVRLDNLRRILRLHPGVKDPLRLDHDDGALFAETMTTGKIHGHPGQGQPGHFLLEQPVDLLGTAGLAACAPADQDLTPAHRSHPSC